MFCKLFITFTIAITLDAMHYIMYCKDSAYALN